MVIQWERIAVSIDSSSSKYHYMLPETPIRGLGSTDSFMR
jgi:hypothetical protein